MRRSLLFAIVWLLAASELRACPYQVSPTTFNAGGGASSGGVYSITSSTGLSGTVGQSAGGGVYHVNNGFWYVAEAPFTATVSDAVNVQSDFPGLPITVSPADLCGDLDGTTPFIRQYAPSTSVTLTAPLEQGFSLFLHWELTGNAQTDGQLVATFMQTGVPILARAVYFDPYDYFIEGFEARTTNPQDPSHDTLISRYTTARFPGYPTLQGFYESHDLAGLPDRIGQYIRMQTLLGNNSLVELERLPYIPSLGDPAIPEFAADEYAMEAQSILAASLLEMEKLLPLATSASELANFDRTNSTPFDMGVTRDLVYGYEVYGKMVLKELAVLGHLAASETDADRELPNSAFQMLVARGALLTSRLEMVQALIANVLTLDETNLVRLPAISTAISQVAVLIESVARNVIETEWLQNLGVDPREVQVWTNFVPNPSITVDEVWNDATSEACNARSQWQFARDAQRQYDQDQTAFSQHVADLRTQYLTQLFELTGLDPLGFLDDQSIPLGDNIAVAAYLAHAFGAIDRPPEGPGPEDIPGAAAASEIAIHIQHIRQADAAIIAAEERVDGILELMRIEQDRAREVINVVRTDLMQQVSLERLIVMYSRRSQSSGTSVNYSDVDLGGGCTNLQVLNELSPCPGPPGSNCEPPRCYQGNLPPGQQTCHCRCCVPAVSIDALLNGSVAVPHYAQIGYGQSRGESVNPDWEELADARQQLVFLQEMQKIVIESVNSEATIRRLLVDLAGAYSELKQRVLEYEGAVIAYRQLVLRIEVILDNYLAARADLANAYFSNPAYREQRDEAEAQADFLLRRAKLFCYRAVRRLELAWAQRYSHALTPNPNSPWADAGSVFRANHPDDCLNFLRSVKDWDDAQKSLQGNQSSDPLTRQMPLSLRRHVLGFSNTYLSGPFRGQILQDPPGSGIPDFAAINANLAAWQDFVRDHTITQSVSAQFTADPVNPALLIRFPLSILTSEGSTTHSPVAEVFGVNRWNQRIRSLDANLVGDIDYLFNCAKCGATNSIEIGIVQRGSSVVRPWPPGNTPLILIDADPWEDYQYPLAYPNAWIFLGTVNENINQPIGYQQPPSGSPLRDRPVSASDWTLYISSAQPGPGRLNFEYLTDIELLFEFDHGGHNHTISVPCP